MKKALALWIVVVMLVGVLASCKKEEKTTESNDATQATGGEATAAGQTEAEVKEWTWPLAEKKELSIWLVWDNEFVENPNDLLAIQEIEKKTNVHINWNIVASTEAAEKFSLMVASGDYPDIIRGAESYYPGGLTKMVDDGISIDLTDLLSVNMPTYSELRNSIEKIQKATITDDQRAVAIYTLASNFGELSGERVWGGPSIRKDWLDEAGLDIPVTMDQWYEALTEIKKNHPECEAPLMMGKAGTNFYGAFLTAYGVTPEFYNDQGTAKYGPVEEGYREWIETMRKWYAEGLIDPNFVTNDASFLASGDYIGTGKAAAGPNLWGFTADVYKSMGYNSDESFWISATPYPVLNEGDKPQVAAPMSEYTKETVVITSNCKDVELAMRYLDYWFTDEVMLLDSLGVENETFVKNADGTYSISQKVKDTVTDGTYPSMSAAVFTHTLGTAHFGLYNWGMFDAIYEGNKATEAYDVWNTASYDLLFPASASMTEEESQEYASLYTNILTLVQENTVKFIMGAQSMDEYDQFVEQLHTYGIDRCLEIKQASLDRYNAR